MIIGVNGRINSGKDTVGKIIQYLAWKNKVESGKTIRLSNYNLEDFERIVYKLSEWQIKKFADKLKDIVCIILNCTRQQLEDRQFKETELGKEWWYYNKTIMIPYLESKDTSKEFDKYLIKLTPRLILQLLGTDCMRNIIHPNIHVNMLMNEYQPLNDYTKIPYYLNDLGGLAKPEELVYPNWIITDLRFKNEFKAVKEKGGINIKILREYKECGSLNSHKMSCSIGFKEHSSEKDLDNETFDYTIINDGTIKDLIDKIKNILTLENIIK